MILEAKNIEYAYKTMKEKKVLNQISMQFEEGKFYTIIGTSGAGKTTFLSLLAGLDVPICGEILYNGENIQRSGLNYHRRNHVSLVFQNYNLIDYLTTEENVKLGGDKNPQKLLSEVNLPQEAWNRNVLQLSGGQQQRVAIARALASRAKVLLADEPTGNLDEDTADEIIELLRKTAHELGKCVIVVTHSRKIADIADEVIQIKDGSIERNIQQLDI
ncbi:MAG: ABC transporter ATP-binding protein [Lachnospiraceae bacterium]|nr:ABC transporter ATP-binding protein [Lachnospiraceae bacterium]